MCQCTSAALVCVTACQGEASEGSVVTGWVVCTHTREAEEGYEARGAYKQDCAMRWCESVRKGPPGRGERGQYWGV